MKIRLVLLSILTFFTVKTYAQPSRFEAGISAGPNYFMPYGNPFINKNLKSRAAVTAGLTFQYNFSKLFALHTNISYERKSVVLRDEFDYMDEFGNVVGRTKFNFQGNFDYITLPLLARAKFGEKVRFFINAGPFAGFLLKQQDISTFSSDAENPPLNITERKNYTKNYKRLDAGLSTGAGISLPVNEKCCYSLEGRWNVGLINISKQPNRSNSTLKTNSLVFLSGFNYNFGII